MKKNFLNEFVDFGQAPGPGDGPMMMGASAASAERAVPRMAAQAILRAAAALM